MEAGTVPATLASSGSKTIADLLPAAAEKHGDRPAQRFKRDGEWHDISFAALWDSAREIGLGLIDLGVAPGDRVCILANTRPEWTAVDFAITSTGACVVPIYQTNSPEECEWVISDSGASAIVVEDEVQLAKIREIRDRVPELRTIVVIDPAGDTEGAIALADLRARGRARDADELRARYEAVGPGDLFTIIYTSGTTGPPKGCMLAHGNYRSVLDMCMNIGVLASEEVVYLYLPLAHSFALLIQLVAVDVGSTIAYFGGDTKNIVAELSEVEPDIPAVRAAGLREDLHAGRRQPAARGAGADEEGGQARHEGARHAVARRGGAG